MPAQKASLHPTAGSGPPLLKTLSTGGFGEKEFVHHPLPGQASPASGDAGSAVLSALNFLLPPAPLVPPGLALPVRLREAICCPLSDSYCLKYGTLWILLHAPKQFITEFCLKCRGVRGGFQHNTDSKII